MICRFQRPTTTRMITGRGRGRCENARAGRMSYEDLGLVMPEGGAEVGELGQPGSTMRKVPNDDDVSNLRLIDRATGEVYTFDSKRELDLFKYSVTSSATFEPLPASMTMSGASWTISMPRDCPKTPSSSTHQTKGFSLANRLV